MAVKSKDYSKLGRVQGRRDHGLSPASDLKGLRLPAEWLSSSRTNDLAGMTDATPEAVRGTGRILRVEFQWMERPFSIVNVYAPSLSAERADSFVIQLLTTIPKHVGAMVAGNWVSDDLDVTPHALGRRRTGYLGGLQLVEETYGLPDVSRDQPPGERAITHVCASDRSGARFDRWLLSLDVLHVAQQSEIWEGLPGDYLEVTLRLQAPSDSCRGPHPGRSTCSFWMTAIMPRS